jgi:acetyl esterase/lipase
VKLLLLLLLGFSAFGSDDFDIVYRKIDGAELKLDAMYPDDSRSHPLILCVHGGGWNMGSRQSFHKFMRQFVASGYSTVTIQYRLSPVAKHPAQVEDIHAALKFVRENAARLHADPQQIILMGASAGAHLALLAGLPEVSGTSFIRAIIDLSGPTDLRDWRMSANADEALRKTTGKTSEDLLELLLGSKERTGKMIESASPITLVRRTSPPVLVIHWKDDQAVALEQAERLVAELKKAEVKHEFVVLEGRGHAFNGPGVETVVPRSVAFLACCVPGK